MYKKYGEELNVPKSITEKNKQIEKSNLKLTSWQI